MKTTKTTTFTDGNGSVVRLKLVIKEKRNVRNWNLKKGNYKTLPITGDITEKEKIKPYTDGQCYDSIKPTTDKQKEVIDIWREYHLNDLTAGSKKQMEALESFKYKNNYYKEACEYLKKRRLLIDDGYKFGSKWLVKPLKNGIIEKILLLFKEIDEN